MPIYLDGFHSPSEPMLSTSEMGSKHVVYRIIISFSKQTWETLGNPSQLWNVLSTSPKIMFAI